MFFRSPLAYSFVSNKVVRHRMIFLIRCSLNSQFKEKLNEVEMLSFWTVSCRDGAERPECTFWWVFWGLRAAIFIKGTFVNQCNFFLRKISWLHVGVSVGAVWCRVTVSFLCAFELQRPDREMYCQYSLSGLTTLLFCVVAFSGLSRVGILFCLSFFFFWSFCVKGV